MTYRTPDSDEILVRRLVKEFAEQAKLISSEASKPRPRVEWPGWVRSLVIATAAVLLTLTFVFGFRFIINMYPAEPEPPFGAWCNELCNGRVAKFSEYTECQCEAPDPCQ